MRCLASIGEQTLSPHEVIVVDNASDDGTREAVAEFFPQVEVRSLSENLGVPAARDTGIKCATGDIIILIDDDAQFAATDAALKTLREFDSSPEVGIIAYCILNSDSRELERRAIPKRDKRPEHLKDGECAYFTGAGFAIRRNVYEQVGPFWERLFYIGEELDLSYRLLAAGFSIRFLRHIEMLHAATPQARPSGQFIYYSTRNRPWLALRHLPWKYAMVTTFVWWASMCAISVRGLNPGPFLRGIRDSLAAFPEVMKLRDPISREVVDRVRRLSGRLWY